MVSIGDKTTSKELGTGPTDIGEPSLGLLVIFSLIGLSLVMLAMSLGIFLSILV
jgi:hypothetical protein